MHYSQAVKTVMHLKLSCTFDCHALKLKLLNMRREEEKASEIHTFKCQICVSFDWSTDQNVFILVQIAGRECQ